MIPAALAILIYQILAILGTEAVNQIVTSIAYKKRDLDFRLMYAQSPLDLFLNYNRFDKKTGQKVTIILFVCLSIALKFIPTIFTKFNLSGFLYYGTTVFVLDQNQAGGRPYWPIGAMPIFTTFYYSRGTHTTLLNLQAQDSSFQDMVTHYISKDLGFAIRENPNGIWFGAKRKITSYAWDDRQVADPHGFTAIDGEGRIAAHTFNAFGFRQGSQTLPLSGTLHGCEESRPDSNERILTSIHGLQVSYAKSHHQVCHPVYDTSLSITISNVASQLDINDTIYRPVQLSRDTLISSSFGISIVNHNSTHMTMGIKKMAHITTYSHNGTDALLFNCSSKEKLDITNNFIDLPYNAVLCDLASHLNNASLQPAIVQAVGRTWIDNYAIDTVYTIQKGDEVNPGVTIMIDFTLFQAFTVDGHLARNREYLVAHQALSKQMSTQDFDYVRYPAFSKDPIGYLHRSSVHRLLCENGYYEVQITPWWIITIVVLTLVFLLPQGTRLIFKRIPEYNKDLRSLLLLTIERAHIFGEDKAVNTVSIVLNELDYESDRVALLAVNGHPVVVGKKVDGPDAIDSWLMRWLGGSEEEQLTPDKRY